MPNVTYFVEDLAHDEPALNDMSRPEFLEKTVFQPETLDLLKKTQSAVSIATGELDIRQSVQELNVHGIPVDLWLTIPEEKGYWSYRGNIEETCNALSDVLQWKAKHGLTVRHIGFDLEPHVGVMKALVRRDLRDVLRQRGSSDPHANDKLEAVIDDVHATGHGVDIYKMRIRHWSIMQRLLNMHAIPSNADKIVNMVYTSTLSSINHLASHIPSMGDLYMTAHLRKGEIPGIGILSGMGVNPGRNLGQWLTNPKYLLRDEQLRKDTRILKQRGINELYVFALNHPEVIRRVERAWGQIEG